MEWMRLLLQSDAYQATWSTELTRAFAHATQLDGTISEAALFRRGQSGANVEIFARFRPTPAVDRMLAIYGFAPGAPRSVAGLDLLYGDYVDLPSGGGVS